MAAFIRRFKGKQKNTEKEQTQEQSTSTLDTVQSKSPSLSPYTSDSDTSPQHVISAGGSLFSGMKLTKTSQAVEPGTSPYGTNTPPTNATPTPEDGQIDPAAKKGFDFITNDTADPNEEVECGFPFLSSETTPTDVGTGSGFTFLTSQEPPPNPSSDEGEEQGNESGFTFLSSTPAATVSDSNVIEIVPSEEPKLSDIKELSPNNQKPPNTPVVLLPNARDETMTTPNHATPTPEAPPSQRVGRQAPPKRTKKKHKALRPGQERTDEAYTGLVDTPPVANSDLEGMSLDGSSCMGSSVGDLTNESSEGCVVIPVAVGDQSISDSQIIGRNEEGCHDDTDNTTEKQGKCDEVGVVDNEVGVVSGDNEVGVVSVNEVCEEDTLVQLEEDGSDVTPTLPKTLPSNNHVSSELEGVFDTEPISDTPGDTPANNKYTVQLSPVEKMTTLIQSSRSKAKTLSESVDAATEQYGSVLERNGDKIRKLTLTRSVVRDLKAKEAAALAEENYELAEEFRQELESISVLSDRDILASSQSTVEQWMSDCSDIITAQVALHVEMREKLSELKEDQSKSLTSLEKEFTTSHAKEKIKLQTTRDELEREKGHISLDREHLEKREMLLQDEISERAAEFIQHKRTLEEEEHQTRGEIEELEKKLAQLRERQSTLLQEIRSEEEKIESISAELSSEHAHLEGERGRVREKEEQLQEQVSSLNQLQLSYEASLELHNKSRDSIVCVVKDIEREVTTHTSGQHQLEQCMDSASSWRMEGIEGIMTPTHALQSFFDKEKLLEGGVNDITAKVVLLQEGIDSCSKAIADQEGQLVKTKDAKKVAVATRQYREAAKLSAEEKELGVKIAEQKEELVATETELSDENRKLLELNEELEQLRMERMREERQADIASIEKLVANLATVKHQVQSFRQSCLLTVFEQWTRFITLLIEDLCVKHSLIVTDYLPLSEEGDKGEGRGKEEDEGGDEGGEVQPHEEERTPGVGMEVPPDKQEVDVIPEVGVAVELKRKIEDLEQEISTCCEGGDYERAAVLDDELNTLKDKHSAIVPTN